MNAFPTLKSLTSSGAPDYKANVSEGMTLRDYFAAQSIGALIIASQNSPATRDDIAHEAYQQADALLSVRSLANPASEPR